MDDFLVQGNSPIPLVDVFPESERLVEHSHCGVQCEHAEFPGLVKKRKRYAGLMLRQYHVIVVHVSAWQKQPDLNQQTNASVGFIRLCEVREFPVCPIKTAAIHDDASNRCAVSANPFCCRMNNDVSSPLQRLSKFRGEGIIDYQ